MMRKIYLSLLLGGLFVGCSENSPSTLSGSEIQAATIINTSSSTSKADNPDLWLGSLITATPQEGRELAILMARKTIGAIQSDPGVKKELRKEYAEDAELLILSAQVVAIEFQTVAEANNYWRK